MDNSRLPERELPEGTWHSMRPPPKRTRLIYGATEEFITESARLNALSATQSRLQSELSRVQGEYFPALAALAKKYPENFDEWEVKHLELMSAIAAAAHECFPTPQAGSALAIDRAEGAPFGIDIVALADRRLQSAEDLLRTVAALPLTAIAFGSNTILTLTRSALLAASELVWLLPPESRVQRLARACSLELVEVSGEKGMLRDLSSQIGGISESADGGPRSTVDVAFEQVASRERVLKEAQSRWGGVDGHNRAVVNAAGKHLSDVHDDKDGDLMRAAITQWSTGSGIAHSNSWQGKYRTSMGSDPLRDLVTASGVPLMMTEAGIALSRVRSHAQPDT